jgi:hypothetical protein
VSTLRLVLLILAAIAFALAALKVRTADLDLMNAGFALVVASWIVA